LPAAARAWTGGSVHSAGLSVLGQFIGWSGRRWNGLIRRDDHRSGVDRELRWAHARGDSTGCSRGSGSNLTTGSTHQEKPTSMPDTDGDRTRFHSSWVAQRAVGTRAKAIVSSRGVWRDVNGLRRTVARNRSGRVARSPIDNPSSHPTVTRLAIGLAVDHGLSSSSSTARVAWSLLPHDARPYA
jgi:hypothetical protein